jgi:hypothetical protein
MALVEEKGARRSSLSSRVPCRIPEVPHPPQELVLILLFFIDIFSHPKSLLSPHNNVILKLVVYGKPMVLEPNNFILFFQIFHKGGGTLIGVEKLKKLPKIHPF